MTMIKAWCNLRNYDENNYSAASVDSYDENVYGFSKLSKNGVQKWNINNNRLISAQMCVTAAHPKC